MLGYCEKKRVPSIFLILFEVAIPQLVCGYILGLRNVTYCFRVTVTLVSVLGKSSPEQICIIFEVGIPNCACGYIMGSWIVAYRYWIILDLISGLGFRKIVKKKIFSVI